MAMNWGAFAGGAANSALGTYSQLNSERMKNLQTAMFMEDVADRQNIKSAAAETFGKVGQDQFANINSLYANPEAAVSPEALALEKPEAPVKYTQQQAAEDFGTRLSAIDPMRGFEFKGKALQLKTAQRQSDLDDEYDKLTKWRDSSMATIYSTLEGKGMSGIPDALNSQLKKAGITLEYKEHSQGPGSIVAKDDKGKVVGTYSGVDQVTSGFKGLISQEYENRLVNLLGSPDKALNYSLQRQKLDVERAKAEAEIQKNRAMAGAYGNRPDTSPKAKIGEYATALVDAGAINPKTSEPYTPAEAKAYAAAIVLRDPNAQPVRVNPIKQNANDYGEMLFESGAVNPVTKKPFASLEEAQKYAMGVALKDPAQAADTRQITELEKIMLPKWPEALASLGPKATPAQVLSLARQMGIRPETLGLSSQTPTQNALSNLPSVGVDQGGLGAPKGTTTPPPKGAPAPKGAPTSAIPTPKAASTPSVGEQNTQKLVAQVQQELPTMTMERARELQSSRGFIALPAELRRQISALATSKPATPDSTLFAPRR